MGEKASLKTITLFFISFLVLSFFTREVFSISTTRSGNLFSADEYYMTINTSLTGTVNWSITNDYGETISGTANVSNGRITIPIYGYLYSHYTITISGDGSIEGGVVPPLTELHPDLSPNIMGLFERRMNTNDALMWKQLGALEFRLEGGLSQSSTWDNYAVALKNMGVRTSFKLSLSGPPSNYDTFQTQCRDFVAHYYPLGVETYYTINEPDTSGWWSGSQEDYYRVQERWYLGAKQAAPNCIMIAPEMWSYDVNFTRTVLNNADHDVFSAHYPSDDVVGDTHSSHHFTEMRKTGKIYPMINGEAQDMNDNYDQADWAKFYPGELGGCVGACFDVGQAGNLDFGMHREVHLGFILYNAAPFAEYSSSRVTVRYQCWQMRYGNDEIAGTQFRRRIPNYPLGLIGWLFKRGSDYYLQAYCPVGNMTQLLEINTSASLLRVVDAFGNSYPAKVTGGKAYVLVGNTGVSVHGMTESDTINFVRRTTNLPPEIINPGNQTAVVGVPFRLKLQGRDPEMVLQRWNSRYPTWSLTGAPSGMIIRPRSGVIEWTPSSAGNYNVTVNLTDSDGALTASETFSINVLASGSNLSPYFVSMPAPAAVKGKQFKYPAKAFDPNGDTLTYSLVQAPQGMQITTTGYITWTPQTVGAYNVTVQANDGRGGTATQTFELPVVPNPDLRSEGLLPPRVPTDLTVVDNTNGITLIWNPHDFADIVVQRATSRTGPWSTIATVNVPATWYRDTNPPAGPVFYRVLARNSGGDSEPSNVVNGRNRAPIAEAGRSVKLSGTGSTQLDGTASFDPDNSGTLTYEWRVITAPINSNPTITNPNSATPTLTLNTNGRYVIGLRVSDGEEISEWDYLWAIAGESGSPQQRVNHSGVDRFVTLGSTISITCWASPYNTSEDWHWRLYDLPVYGYVRFSTPDPRNHTASNSFCPEIPGVYTVSTVAKDDWMHGYPDYVKIYVAPQGSGDTTPPSPINTLTVSSTTTNSVTLVWTATGDDGTTGTASGYDLRYAYNPITTEQQFQSATVISGVPSPKPSGQQETFTVTNLSPGTTYYFSIKARDEAFNWSGLSNSPSGVTKGAQPQAVKILLSANPTAIPADGTSTSIITATVCDALNNPVVSSTATIRFALSGSGTLIGQNPVQVNNAVATITYKAGNSAGTATITATSQGLTQGQINITLQQVLLPQISVSTTTLEFSELPIGEQSTLSFDIINTGGGTLSGTITSGEEWIDVQPDTFAGNQTTVNVTVDNSILNKREGQYTGKINITSNGGDIEITVIVNATCILTRPNPYDPEKGKLEFFGDGIVPEKTTIKIWTLSGELIKVIQPESVGKIAIWDGKTDRGKKIVSGLYIYTYESPREKGTGKFTVK